MCTRPMMLSLCVAAAVVVGGGAGPADAAVRKCLPVVSVDAADAKSETVARRKALEAWVLQAEKNGPGYASWGMSANRVLDCKKDGGTIKCAASASPCVILQNPNQLPPDVTPAVPRRAPNSGLQI